MGFESKFRKILKEEDDNLEDLGLDPEMERDEMEKSLDDDVSGDDFDLDMEPTGETDEIADAFSRQTQEIIDKIDRWENQTKEFLEFLNGENPDSIQSQLASAPADTIMDKMKQSQQSKVARIASDLASFQQSLLGFKSQATNTEYKGV